MYDVGSTCDCRKQRVLKERTISRTADGCPEDVDPNSVMVWPALLLFFAAVRLHERPWWHGLQTAYLPAARRELLRERLQLPGHAKQPRSQRLAKQPPTGESWHRTSSLLRTGRPAATLS